MTVYDFNCQNHRYWAALVLQEQLHTRGLTQIKRGGSQIYYRALFLVPEPAALPMKLKESAYKQILDALSAGLPMPAIEAPAPPPVPAFPPVEVFLGLGPCWVPKLGERGRGLSELPRKLPVRV